MTVIKVQLAEDMHLIRRALAVVLLASALKMFGVPTVVLAWTLLALIVVAVLSWALLRGRNKDTETVDSGV